VPKFYYIARNRSGAKVTGIEDAPTQEEAISRLQTKDLIIINIIPEGRETAPSAGSTQQAVKAKPRLRHNRITEDDLTLFCRQIATLLGAGVTILNSLDIISQQVSSRRLYLVIKDLQKRMEEGLSFHEAMSKRPDVFSALWINLVESGEASGNLAVILNRLASYLERNAAFKRKVISAIIYPVILILAASGAFLFITIQIIPVFEGIFKEFNITLPLLTQILIGISFFIRKRSIIVIIVLVAAWFGIKNYIRTKPGRRKLEALQLKLPMFGDFFRGLTVERFSSEMSTLLESGVPILYSLEITERSVDNLLVGSIIHDIKEAIREGKSLKQQFEKSGYFDPMVVQMIGIGEEIGELPQMFKRINAFYQEYIETFLTRFVSMFEPFLLLFIGALIGIMLVGIFMPIFQIAKIG
jgi:type II secretory pathway component PulF